MAELATTKLETESSAVKVSYNDIARKLLKDKLLLTALELHTELVESGKEVKQLKDFFSNPGNFELQTQEYSSRISRSGSQTTLDSLDFTRYSEDGERGSDERIAVLEFELRKAKETITALRNNLTVATESEKNTPDKSNTSQLHQDCIKPHEQRPLNFLINEYLLLHGYKLTSITFSDENENQDFEDWDDVGLNISKPAELLILYREGLKQTRHNLRTATTQTDFILKNENDLRIIEKLQSENSDLNLKIQSLKVEIQTLEGEISNLQEENTKLTKKYESSQKTEEALSDIKTNSSGKNSTIGSDSPEHFELIDKIQLSSEDNISNTSVNVGDWTRLSIGKELEESPKSIKNEIIEVHTEKDVVIEEKKHSWLSDRYKKELLSLCPTNISHKAGNDVLDSVLNEPGSLENLVNTVSESLLRIIPNIILNKREEAIPLLISAVQLNSNSSIRDKLLQQLFNLKKRPSEVERALILTGIIGIAKYSKESIVENEILPQCWEQLTHKHVERRLLVAESCRVLIPYVSPPIRNSLMLSMLQQMLEDREEVVREEVIKALALVVAFCDDVDKYSQCEELAFDMLKDTGSGVVCSAVNIFFPVVAKWSLDIGRLRSDLFRNLLHKLNDLLKLLKNESPSKIKPSPDVILRILKVLNQLLPFILISVASNEVILNRIEKDLVIEIRPSLLKLCTNLTNPTIFYESSYDIGMMLYRFEQFIEEECCDEWEEMDWITDIVFPDLLNSLNHVDITQHELLHGFIDLFSNFCVAFGKPFTLLKIRPLFQTQVQNLEQILSSFNQYSPSLNVIPVYLVSILSFCDIEDMANVLRRFLCALPLCGTPLDCLEITVRRLCRLGMQETVTACLWDGVVHPRPLVRAVTAGLFATIIGSCSETLLNAKVTPALVTLANDSDMLVRTATIPALGCLITDCSMQELHDKSYMQLQMFLSDPATKENHTLLRQLVVTMGNIVTNCKQSFRSDVILPQLTSLSTFMSQMSSQTRKVDMAVALIEAFSNVIYSPINDNTISNIVLPGLRYLELAVNESQTLHPHRNALLSMIKECENRVDISSPQSPSEKGGNKITQNVNQGVEDMKQRVSKIFNKPVVARPPSLSNLQGLFKKK